MKRPRTLLTALALILATVATASERSPGAGFDGVWLIEKAPSSVRTTDGKAPPLLPEARKQYEADRARRARGDLTMDHTTWCASAGLPRLMLESLPFEIMVNRRQVALLFQWNRWAHLIDMTGNDLQPIYPLSFGTSNGHWEGETLVIVSRQISAETYIDRSGLPHSDDLMLTQRLRLKSPDVLENRMRFEDPATFSTPWETVVTYRRQNSPGIGEDVCLDRIRDGKPAIQGAP